MTFIRNLVNLRVPNASMVLGVTKLHEHLHGLVIEFDSAPSVASLLFGDIESAACSVPSTQSPFSGAVFDDELRLGCQHIVSLSPQLLQECFGIKVGFCSLCRYCFRTHFLFVVPCWFREDTRAYQPGKSSESIQPTPFAYSFGNRLSFSIPQVLHGGPQEDVEHRRHRARCSLLTFLLTNASRSAS